MEDVGAGVGFYSLVRDRGRGATNSEVQLEKRDEKSQIKPELIEGLDLDKGWLC